MGIFDYLKPKPKKINDNVIKDPKSREAFERLDDGSDFMKGIKQTILEGQKLKEEGHRFYTRNMAAKYNEQIGLFDKAISEYEKNINEFPELSRSCYFNICDIYRNIKDYSSEIKTILRAMNSIDNGSDYYEKRMEKALILKAKSEGVKIERRKKDNNQI